MHTCTDKGRDVKIYLIGVKIQAETSVYAMGGNINAYMCIKQHNYDDLPNGCEG